LVLRASLFEYQRKRFNATATTPSMSNMSFILNTSYNLLAFFVDTLERDKEKQRFVCAFAPIRTETIWSFLFDDFML
jgi:hypothetical protein